MLRNSWKRHLVNKAHLRAVQTALETAKSVEATNTHYSQVYTMGSTSLQTPSLTNPAPRAQFHPILDEDTNGIGPEDFEMSHFPLPDLADEALTRANNSEILRREIEILMLQHLEDEFEGGDDETVPNLTEEMRQNGKWQVHALSQF